MPWRLDAPWGSSTRGTSRSATCTTRRPSASAGSTSFGGATLAPESATALIPVVAGTGNRRLFEGEQASLVIEGGQTMNPSVGQIHEAITAVNADSVIVLPNNGNVRLAAEQRGRRVDEGRTRDPHDIDPRGPRGGLVFDPDSTWTTTQRAMSGGGGAVSPPARSRAPRATPPSTGSTCAKAPGSGLSTAPRSRPAPTCSSVVGRRRRPAARRRPPLVTVLLGDDAPERRLVEERIAAASSGAASSTYTTVASRTTRCCSRRSNGWPPRRRGTASPSGCCWSTTATSTARRWSSCSAASPGSPWSRRGRREAALRACRELDVDLVLLDYRLPDATAPR